MLSAGMETIMKRILTCLILLALINSAQAADKKEDDKTKWKSETFNGLEFRGVGPAIMSGRITDIAVHPKNKSTFYVAAASGGVWKQSWNLRQAFEA